MFYLTKNARKPPKGPKNSVFLSLVTLTFDLWHWPWNLSERWIKHVFRVNLVQIRSAVSDIFHTQTKTPQTDRAKNRTFRSPLRAVKIRLLELEEARSPVPHSWGRQCYVLIIFWYSRMWNSTGARDAVILKPNSITLAASELLGASSELARVMEFGFYEKSAISRTHL